MTDAMRARRMERLLRLGEMAERASVHAHAEALARARAATDRLHRLHRLITDSGTIAGGQSVAMMAGGAHLRGLLDGARAQAETGQAEARQAVVQSAGSLGESRTRIRQLSERTTDARATVRRAAEDRATDALPSARPRR